MKTFREYLIGKYDLPESRDIIDPSRHYKSSSAASQDILDPSRHYKSSSAVSPRMILARIKQNEEKIKENEKAGRHDDNHYLHAENAETLARHYGDVGHKSMAAVARKYLHQHGNYSANDITAKNNKENIDYIHKELRPRLEADVAELDKIDQRNATITTITPKLPSFKKKD